MNKKDLQKFSLPDAPGVYFFKRGKEILYIGKATSLRDRVKSYFSADIISTRGSRIVDMVTLSDSIDFQTTDSVLEALILESNLIKRFQPKYNIKEKDDKSYNFVTISKDEFPIVQIERGRTIEFTKTQGEKKYKYVFGPFAHGGELRSALKIVRKIFPFFSKKQLSPLYAQIGLEPDTTDSNAKKHYAKTINHLRLFFEGKKKTIEKELEKEMMAHAKKQEFERAEKIKRQLFALQHIRDVSMIKDMTTYEDSFRIEAFDVAHQSGQNTVGVMVVFDNDTPIKSEYRKFIIRKAKRADDVGALKELLERRLKHTEWKYPDLVVIDGGTAQRRAAESFLKPLNIPVVSVVKDERHKPRDIQGSSSHATKHKKTILLSNNEAHRFAVSFLHTKERKRMI